MDITLNRKQYTPDGIFGEILYDKGRLIFVTLEHAYDDPANNFFVPKLAAGLYTCQRYDSPELGYPLFHILNVPDFQYKPVTFIEIHIGNYQKDSKGCVLLGNKLGDKMILESEMAFKTFMDLQSGIDNFKLTVNA